MNADHDAVPSVGNRATRVAYFSMEVAIREDLPTYSGGLGVLAGDTLRAAADLDVPMTAVTLVHRKGYFRQRLDAAGNQSEDDASWSPEKELDDVGPRVSIRIEGREVVIRAWRFCVRGYSQQAAPVSVYLLDTDLPENSSWDRSLTDHLYGGDHRYRLAQEAVLGIGGIELLDRLGYSEISSYHMNEGHAALLALGLLERQTGGRLEGTTEDDIRKVRRACVFTTHTPVPAGHDQFPRAEARAVLGDAVADVLDRTNCCHEGLLNMTLLALRFSHYVNGVGMHHGEISRDMFPGYPVRAITNGVHAATWASEPLQAVFDLHIPEWRSDNRYLRYAVGIPLGEIRDAHAKSKRTLLDEVERSTGRRLDPAVLTIGFARRATTYKRPDLLLSNLDRLSRIARNAGPLQVIYGGKAHPRDEGGKALIRKIFGTATAIDPNLTIVYVENYDMRWGRLLTAGTDLWLNTPHRPYEASGTSGMKAALNGVPSLSILDGWWIEGCLEGHTGWAIGHDGDGADDVETEIASLYDKLERVILPLFYGSPEAYANVMRTSIAVNGSFFNAQRMLEQYIANAYRFEG